MFDENGYINLKLPVIIIVCLVVLGSSIFIGIKSNQKQETEVTVINHENVEQNKKEEPKQEEIITDIPTENTSTNVFAISETCEIWLKKGQDENLMIGLIPKELLNKSEEEIRNYLKNAYPDKNIDSITYGQIVLSQDPPKKSNTIKNKYSIEVENGLIGVFKYDINGNRTVEKQTSIKIDLLPQSVQEQIQQTILVDDLDEAYSILENLSS